ncbi:5030_t:CDS:2 [Funneliformis caledonium]|uniref:5030_t:CDS:1 n=1 Tax=Funneliformis caledonium TaxID=1117310 RepID=A0A9N9H354_9GLOM|nr:5030_t:CDS:2 [Funneliformis caledonium]
MVLRLRDESLILYILPNHLDPRFNYDFTNINDNGMNFEQGNFEYKCPCVSYHGTTKHNCKSIAEGGYDLRKFKRFTFDGNYLTPDIDIATQFIHVEDRYQVVFHNRVNPNNLVRLTKKLVLVNIGFHTSLCQQLLDNHTLESYNIQNGSNIHLLMKLQGGGIPTLLYLLPNHLALGFNYELTNINDNRMTFE